MFIKKEGVNMKDMNALNHKLQTMTRKELETICKAHNCKINVLKHDFIHDIELLH